jgi:conjugal transfer pilus assembly protein TraF
VKQIGLILMLIFPLGLLAGWLDRKAEGWAWYEDRTPKEPKLEETGEEPQPLPLPLPPPLSASEEIKKSTKELEEILAQAILNPTDENVARYMTEQKKRVDQSAAFAKAWAKVLLKYPNLDSTTQGTPVSQYGIQVYKHMQHEKQFRLIQSLAKEHAVLFFYEGQNPASQAFALVVQEFAKKYKWIVLGVSVDGYFLEGFKENKPDNGITRKMGVTVFPSIFVVNPKTNEVTPIAFGLASLDQVETNISLQFSAEKS